MIHCLIITKNEVSAKAMKRQLPAPLYPHLDTIPHLQSREPNTAGWTVSDEFNRISDWIERTVADDTESVRDLRDTLIITDIWPLTAPEVEQLNPVAPTDVWAQLMAMLLLAFPEVQWVYAGEPCEVEGTSQTHDSLFRDAHCLDFTRGSDGPFRLHQLGFTPLFDPTGLRNAVRKAMGADDRSRALCNGIPQRIQVALAIDEEKAYAQLHAYAAYRFGFRSHVVTRFRMMKDRLLNKDSCVDFGEHFLSMEDLYLRFSEQPTEARYSELGARDAPSACPRLTDAAYRMIVTSGHRRPADRRKLERACQYLDELQRKYGLHYQIVSKPPAGIFGLWSDFKWGDKLGKTADGKNRTLAVGFEWPPPMDDCGEDADSRDHSAPGRLLEIANRLIDRAERLLPNVRTVGDCVQGAVLASDALELLTGRTPTTALQALALKQQFEVLAECQFYGVRASLDVKARIQDIETEVTALARWFDQTHEDYATRNAEASILSKLILIYRSHNHFDEEQKLLCRARELSRDMWFEEQYHKPRKGWLKYVKWVVSYVQFLLRSPMHFAGITLAWVACLTLMYWITGTYQDLSPFQPFQNALHTFFGGEPPQGTTPTLLAALLYLATTIVAVVAGFVHLGILVSHIYTLVARR